MNPVIWTRGDYQISTDPAVIDLDLVHRYLAEESYWAAGVPRAVVEKSIAHSLCFSVLHHSGQVGFARLITDRATFAYLADVFILTEHRGHGLGKWLVECIKAHPELPGLRRWLLATADAHGLYTQFGFKALAKPQNMLEIRNAEVYQKGSSV